MLLRLRKGEQPTAEATIEHGFDLVNGLLSFELLGPHVLFVVGSLVGAGWCSGVGKTMWRWLGILPTCLLAQVRP